jgi:hypothetical protein
VSPNAIEGAQMPILIPLKRMGSAQELAPASKGSNYVTGIDLQVDGGIAQI